MGVQHLLSNRGAADASGILARPTLVNAQMLEPGAEMFVLIDLVTGNVVSDFDAVDDALASIRWIAGSHGWLAVNRLSLLRVQGEDQSLIAMEDALVDIARTPVPTPTAAFMG